MEYTIRNCEISDLPKLVILCQKHAEYEKADYSLQGKEEALKKILFKLYFKFYLVINRLK